MVNGDIVNTPIRTGENFTKGMILNNIKIGRDDTKNWGRNNVVNQITQESQNNHSASKCLNRSFNTDTKN